MAEVQRTGINVLMKHIGSQKGSIDLFRYSHCTELKQEIEQLMEEFVPTWIRSSPVEETNATDAMVIVRNRTHLERATTANCLVVTSVSITLYYAKQGTQANHRLLIVSAIYDMNLEAVHVVPNSTIALRFSTQFKDVTPSKSYEL
ncbi:hypothetical protein KIN20_028645 [Parelaphostrongylus tenuis]|uniref:Uncharacterized protein n=1 Tax=Parelaphostrongylus tenuis TaxID=148309 RepID=A0AAD5R192_PARTN|nr:hypothetical protein KIN20_028638 [Parelaphostrongylus tenuis]KAJ1367687.1 hypothetical protein KIN20_028645 [Parelaphostrongylus tenuis]